MEIQDNDMTQRSNKPIGKPGLMAKYHHEKKDGLPGSVVSNLTLMLGSVEKMGETEYQWGSSGLSVGMKLA